MDDRTGKIVSEEEVKKMSKKEQKHFLPIPEQQLGRVQGMNRAQRRKWAAEERRKKRK